MLAHALEGVRVVDLTRLLPGPFASMLLGDLGAEVYKVEETRGGDYARHYQPFAGPMGVFFASINRNKKSVALNLKDPRGVQALRALLSQADVLLESFRPGVLARLGLDPEVLRRDFPRLVICSLSGYGQSGPARAQAGHDLTYLARAGMVATGQIPPFQVADIAGGALYGVTAVLAALLARARTGQGAALDISMTDGALSLMGPSLALLQAGAGPEVTQMLHGALPCYRIYPTADGQHLAVAALEPHFWQRFCQVAGLEALATDGMMHGEPGQAVVRQVEARIASEPLAHWEALFAQADACCAPVRRPEQTLEDPLFQSRGLFFTLEGHGERFFQVATPVTPQERGAFLPPPVVGQHSRELLSRVMAPEAVEALLRDGVALQASGS